MILSQELRKGTIYKYQGSPYTVLDYSHTQLARGSAVVRVKVKNLLTGVIIDFSYNSSERFEEADVENKDFQYLYSDEKFSYFMDIVSFDQVELPIETMGEKHKFLKENENYQLILYENKPVGLNLPKSATLTVNYTEPGFKGDTSGNTLKPATCENGIIIKVPLFIKIGDRIKINTDTMDYKERDS
ncbi:elongation factor P [Patescibacteria group bacterium]|nr:elongation factor P [Patescibacteria group bacterium]